MKVSNLVPDGRYWLDKRIFPFNIAKDNISPAHYVVGLKLEGYMTHTFGLHIKKTRSINLHS